MDAKQMKLPCKVHEAANIFPMMSAEEFAGLKKDIAENGVRDKIVFWDGKLLDGRNRLSAMVELDIDWEQHRRDLKVSEDPVAYVISHNLHRRHLDTSQRAMVAAKLRPIFEQQAKERQQIRKGEQAGASVENLPQLKARDAAGEALNVSGKTVDAATAVLETGNKELISLVEQGEVAVSAVAKQLKEDQASAAEILERIKNGEPSPKASGPDQFDKLFSMHDRARTYFEQLVAERRDNEKSNCVLNLYESLDSAVKAYRKSISRKGA